MPSVDDYLMSAWMQLSPAHDKRAAGVQFPRGFWPDLARLAVEQALAGLSEEQLAESEQLAAANYKADWAAVIPEEHSGLKRLRSDRQKAKDIHAALLTSITFDF